MKHVTFPQAQWLRDKGFDEECKEVFSLDMVGDTIPHIYPSEHYNGKHQHIWLRPELPQVVDWLLEKHGIWVEVRHIKTFGINRFHIIIWDYKDTRDYYTIYHDGIGPGYKVWDTPQEAYSAAFDYIKDKGLI